MSDIGLTWDPIMLAGDAVLFMGDLAGLDDLTTSVIISLFSWRRANDDDVLPDESTNRQGFWGDLFADVPHDQLGSRLWLLSREVITQETLNRAKEYAEEALQWMIEDGVASQVQVEVERNGLHQISLGVTIYRTSGGVLPLRFEQVWEGVKRG